MAQQGGRPRSRSRRDLGGARAGLGLELLRYPGTTTGRDPGGYGPRRGREHRQRRHDHLETHVGMALRYANGTSLLVTLTAMASSAASAAPAGSTSTRMRPRSYAVVSTSTLSARRRVRRRVRRDAAGIDAHDWENLTRCSPGAVNEPAACRRLAMDAPI